MVDSFFNQMLQFSSFIFVELKIVEFYFDFFEDDKVIVKNLAHKFRNILYGMLRCATQP